MTRIESSTMCLGRMCVRTTCCVDRSNAVEYGYTTRYTGIVTRTDSVRYKDDKRKMVTMR